MTNRSPRNIVPPSSFVVHALMPIPGFPPPNLTNHGGTVLPSVEVIPIYWGSEWGSSPNAALASQLDGFFDFIVTSELIDMLGEYSLPGMPIEYGSRPASVRMTGSEPGANGQVSDGQIQAALQGWISGGQVPANNANTLYFVYTPPNVTVNGPGGDSCGVFCGYHHAFGSNIYYAVIPYVNCFGCEFPGPFFDTLTEVSSHELCEAITDPALSTWWDPNTRNEIGDICNRETVRLGGYLVQTEWSNERGACVIGPKVARTHAAIDGYQSTFNNQQHVNYVGSDQHVHELVYTNDWSRNDLTAATGAPSAAPGSAIDGYETTFNNQQHVNFIGADNHVYELVYTDRWNHTDLTAATGAPLAAPGSALDGYETTFNNQQHVNFIGADNHVHELVYTNGWSHTDLTAVTGAPPAAPGSALDGYQTTFNDQQHVNFIGADNHVYELVYTDRWNHTDLTAVTGAPPAAPGSALDGYQTMFNNQQHVNYIGTDNHVHELVYTDAWHHTDLTAVTGAPPAAPGSALGGYQTTFNNQQHVTYIGTDRRVHELVYTNGWSHNDLTAATGAPLATPGSALDGYQTTFNNQQHVNFIGTDNHVHELVYTNGWSHNDLGSL